ncbi:MAG TPA: carboxypeptidase-like regulatory domain-containing protein [Chitinophagaceae bacterium]|nr:carboxypeptidase-like regulatory domain-containing protein [Chitinophagaceae bacterium]
MIFKKVYFFILLCPLSFFASAQSSGTLLTGIISDARSKSPLEFATIQLLKVPDSSVIKTTVTDRKGKFSIESVNRGSYVLICTFIGYEKIKKSTEEKLQFDDNL